jgi:hypothetical protein
VIPCTEWPGARTKAGYGRKSVTIDGKRKVRVAHRWVWEQANGPIPPGKILMHSCDNPPCIELRHLTLATQAKNIEDMIAKGRQRSAPGERNARAKLTEGDVRVIRQRRAAGEVLRTIAADYGITMASVCSIARRQTWTHVADLKAACAP